MHTTKEDGLTYVDQNIPLPLVDMGDGPSRRMSMKRAPSDFTSVVISQLSYVFGENLNLSEEENIDEVIPVPSIPTPLSFTGKLRIERDYTLGEAYQFSMEYPSELEDKISQSQFQESMSKINLLLYRAESDRNRHLLDHLLECISLYTFPLCFGTFYQKHMDEFDRVIQTENAEVYIPVGLKLWNPRRYAFLYLEIEFLKNDYQLS